MDRKHTERNVVGMFYDSMATLTGDDWAMRVANFNPNSDQTSEEYLLSDRTPMFREWIGPRAKRNIEFGQLTIPNVKFEATLRRPKDDFIYDKTGQLADRINGFAMQSVRHWRRLITDALSAGTSAVGVDGATFFSANHLNSQTNNLGKAQVSALQVAAPTAPTAVQLAAAVLGVVAYMNGYLDADSEPVNEGSERFFVLLPSNMAAVGTTVATKDVIENGSGAVRNVLDGAGFEVDMIHNARQGQASTTFYVGRTDTAERGIQLQERGGVQLTAKADGSDFEHDTDEWEFGAKAVRGSGLYQWSSLTRCTFEV